MHLPSRRLNLLFGLLVSAPLAVAGWPGHADASVNVKQLLTAATHDNNTVHTLEYTSTVDVTSKYRTIHTVVKGEEDEVANREQDHEQTAVQTVSQKGQKQSVHYTVDIVFINGRTYYRSTLSKSNVWQEKPGMSAVQDPVLGTSWKRGRTLVSFLTPSRYSVVSQGSQIHLRARLARGAITGTDDIYLTGGATPYLVREVEQLRGTVQGQPVTQRTDTRYGPFNQTLGIGVPSTGA